MADLILASKIVVERLQTREQTNSQLIDDYAERMKAGDTFPPITVVTDGKDAWLVDGIHRLDAAIKAKVKIGVEYVRGNRTTAVEMACGANISHGLRRSPADKRRAVKLAIQEFSGRSDRQIAELCAVGHPLVADVRKGLAEVAQKRDGASGRNSTPNSSTSENPEENATSDSGEEAPENPSIAPSEPPVPLDSMGQEIPKKLIAAFELAAIFEEKAKVLTALKKWADDIESGAGATWLHCQSFRADLSNAQSALRQNKAYAVCPYCSAKKPKCEGCKGVGYVTKRIYESAPSELRM